MAGKQWLTIEKIDIMTLHWAILRCNGLSSPANPAYTVKELQTQLTACGAKTIFTCVPLLETAMQAAKSAGIARERVFLCEVPGDGQRAEDGFKTLDQLIEEGKSLPEIEIPRWRNGQGASQTAFLVFSSGTTGLPVKLIITSTWD